MTKKEIKDLAKAIMDEMDREGLRNSYSSDNDSTLARQRGLGAGSSTLRQRK